VLTDGAARLVEPFGVTDWSPFDVWEPEEEVRVSHGQTRRGRVVVACLGYWRALFAPLALPSGRRRASQPGRPQKSGEHSFAPQQPARLGHLQLPI
jgi:hypothetical protein